MIKKAPKSEDLAQVAFRTVRHAAGMGDNPETYCDSVYRKLQIAEYHRDEARRAWKSLHKNGFRAPSPQYSEFYLAYEANFYAYCQSLHSILDISAQMVNVAVLGASSLDEYDVSFTRVLEKVKGLLGSPPCTLDRVIERLEVLKKLEEFRNLEAFVNTIKHRNLLDSQFLVVFNPQIGYKRGIQIMHFEYKYKKGKDVEKRTIPDLWSDDVFAYYDVVRTEIQNLCDLLGK
jgi:hypothetical protein